MFSCMHYKVLIENPADTPLGFVVQESPLNLEYAERDVKKDG